MAVFITLGTLFVTVKQKYVFKKVLSLDVHLMGSYFASSGMDSSVKVGATKNISRPLARRQP